MVRTQAHVNKAATLVLKAQRWDAVPSTALQS